MASTELTAYLAIAAPYPWEPKVCQALMYESLNELCSLSGRIDLSFEEFGACKPSIELLLHNKRGKDSPKNFFPKKELDIAEVLKIGVKVHLPVEAPNGLGQEDSHSPAELKSIFLCLIRNIFKKRVYDLFVIANLARVGSLEIHDSCLVQDGKKEKKPFQLNVSELRFALMFAQEIGWPKFHKLKIGRSWKWALQRPGFLEGFSNDATSRALNAFSHLFKLNDGPITLFWAIMGIEALYVRGREPKMEQVRERTQVLLGEQTSFKKKISGMYNFRSSFIHGDLDFPGRNLLRDATSEVESHDSALNEATSLAIAVLTATLQVLISRNWKGLEFSSTVRNSE